MIQQAFERGEGILQLALAWVPRTFCIPGKRIKLHPADYYSFFSITVDRSRTTCASDQNMPRWWGWTAA